MGDPKATSSSSSFSLPPGCRFYPSEEQLLCYYLHHKNDNSSSSSSLSDSNPNFYGAIKEINLYDFNPFELPVVTSFRFGYRGRKRHWYCYTERINGREEERGSRRAGFGFWKRKGRVRDVLDNGGKVILGRRNRFVFYLHKCNGKSAVRTDWIMYEYSLIDDIKTIEFLATLGRSAMMVVEKQRQLEVRLGLTPARVDSRGERQLGFVAVCSRCATCTYRQGDRHLGFAADPVVDEARESHPTRGARECKAREARAVREANVLHVSGSSETLVVGHSVVQERGGAGRLLQQPDSAQYGGNRPPTGVG